MTSPQFPQLFSVVQNLIKNTLQNVFQTSGSKLAKFHFAKKKKKNIYIYIFIYMYIYYTEYSGNEISLIRLYYVTNNKRVSVKYICYILIFIDVSIACSTIISLTYKRPKHVGE